MNPIWLAPEVLLGGRATAASDVYSFGLVLYELLTWQLPWAGLPYLQVGRVCWWGQARVGGCEAVWPTSSQVVFCTRSAGAAAAAAAPRTAAAILQPATTFTAAAASAGWLLPPPPLPADDADGCHRRAAAGALQGGSAWQRHPCLCTPGGVLPDHEVSASAGAAAAAASRRCR